VEHNFGGPAYTLGIEEELMVLDATTLDLAGGAEHLVEDVEAGAIKHELHESVVEISTQPCSDVREAEAQLRALRNRVRERAAEHGLTVGSSGTHPFARWEQQRISPAERYRQLVADIGFVARQELIFGLHVHVALDDPDTAIRVANGVRLHLAPLLALSANSPFWQGEDTGLASARLPIFRQFPRVGVPPYYGDWADWTARMDALVDAGVIKDHTWMWYDVRVHPGFGTVEVRSMDAQTRVQDTVALAALVQALVRALAEDSHDAPDVAYELLDENRWLAARAGLDGELVDLPGHARRPARELVEALLDRVGGHADDLGSTAALSGIRDLLDGGTGAARQHLVYDANRDFHELVDELVKASAG
jgi:carboxylate-amine ligase